MATIYATGQKSLTLGEFRRWTKNMGDDTLLAIEASPIYGHVVFAKVVSATKIGKAISLSGKEK